LEGSGEKDELEGSSEREVESHLDVLEELMEGEE
jgi:hypothetical protein